MPMQKNAKYEVALANGLMVDSKRVLMSIIIA